MSNQLLEYWYQKKIHPILFPFIPFSKTFSLIVRFRRWLYQKNFLKKYFFPVPIIVVGNITLGGTGKTPFVIWLSQFLKNQGYYPGIISRGFGGIRHQHPLLIDPKDPVEQVGDESVLLAKNSGCPVSICIDRAASVQKLLESFGCDVIISDDGLQHYRLNRDLEIVMIDGKRRLGNGYLLPAGPLRESAERLHWVDMQVIKDGNENDPWAMKLEPLSFVSLTNEKNKIDIKNFPFPKFHAIAGIGHPENFFDALRCLGYPIIPHVFPDHYRYCDNDFKFDDPFPIVMTEKDAVKCLNFADERFWFVAYEVQVKKGLEQKIMELLNRK